MLSVQPLEERIVQVKTLWIHPKNMTPWWEVVRKKFTIRRSSAVTVRRPRLPPPVVPFEHEF
jgi:hypothetical protein